MFIDSPDLFAGDPPLLGVVDVACLAAKEALLAAAAVAVAAAAADADVVVVEAVGPDEAGVGARARRRGRPVSDLMFKTTLEGGHAPPVVGTCKT